MRNLDREPRENQRENQSERTSMINRKRTDEIISVRTIVESKES